MATGWCGDLCRTCAQVSPDWVLGLCLEAADARWGRAQAPHRKHTELSDRLLT